MKSFTTVWNDVSQYLTSAYVMYY